MKDLEYLIRVPKRKPLLNIVQRKRRVQWSKEHVSRDLQFWKSIIFNDECKFVVPLNNSGKVLPKKMRNSILNFIHETIKIKEIFNDHLIN